MSEFDASASAVGYLFQCRHALYSSLRKLRDNDPFSVRLEVLDDVSFEGSGTPVELLQLKHHKEGAAKLTNASPDLWKTIRVWCEAGVKDALLFLITTSAVSKNSAAALLRDDKRRAVSDALKALEATASTSKNEKNKAAYRAFLKLSRRARKQLLARVHILDGSPTILELDSLIQREIRLVVERKFEVPFVQRLEGWWFRQCISTLCTSSQSILSEDLEAQINDLREQFKRDSLPIDDDILDICPTEVGNDVFVEQLSLAAIGAQRVLAAVRDYYRAFEQRSRWVREDLLLVGELNRYEQKLTEEWELVFARVRDDLGEAPAEEAKTRAARDVYRWVETTIVPIRKGVSESFVTRGSLHILANKLRVGWHPEFMSRLEHLLEASDT